MDLRVEDSEEPLKELRRLVKLRRAYNAEDEGDNFIAAKNPEAALKAYAEAARLAPEVVELQFWAAVSMYTNGQEAEALKLFRTVFSREQRWVDLVPRLAQVGLFPNDPKKIEEVQRQRPRSRLERGRGR
jgi:tetratricopeptide (TPR) repeat protein